MIKNYQLVEAVESEYLSHNILAPDEALTRMGDMYDFYIKYGGGTEIKHRDSSHLKALIRVTQQFASLKRINQ